MTSGRVLALAHSFEHDAVTSAQFRSSVSAFDFDILIIDPAAALFEYSLDPWATTYMGLRALSDDDSVNLRRDVDRRRQEILDFVDMGRTAVVFVPPPTDCYVATGERQHSGTGRNRQTTRVVTTASLLRSVPAKYSTRPAGGRSISFIGPPALSDFWRANRERFEYRAIFDETPGTPVMQVTGTNKVVSSLLTAKGGNVLFLPSLDDDRLSAAAARRAHRTFIDSLLDAIGGLGGVSEPLPEWSFEILVPGEAAAAESLQRLESSIADLVTQRDDVQANLLSLRQLKYLITGSGKDFERAVERVFVALGADIHPADEGRTDLRMTLASEAVVVESKGKKASAAEGDAAQLEKWVALEVADGRPRPKAVLAVNAFREASLGTRSEAFPDQMLRYSTSREHCLITGWQLLAAFTEVARRPEAADEIARAILNTTGRFARYPTWEASLDARDRVDTEVKADSSAATPDRRRRSSTPATKG